MNRRGGPRSAARTGQRPPPATSTGADPLAALHHPPADAAARFGLVRAAILRESPRVRTPNFAAVAAADLARLLDLYDEHFFGGLLGELLRRSGASPVGFRLSERMTRTAGTTTRHRTRRREGFRVVEAVRYEIAVSSCLLFQAFRDDLVPGSVARPVDVAGVACADRLDALLRIFEHELLHLAEFLAYGQSSCSAAPFRRLGRAVFGHEASVHAMITMREVAAAVHSIRVGDPVAFAHAGVERRGVVNRITKRATVLVPDAAGDLYRDGNRYLRFLVPLDRLRKG